ncbi:unnamed protein product [Wickerhamomyces anomalus]
MSTKQDIALTTTQSPLDTSKTIVNDHEVRDYFQIDQSYQINEEDDRISRINTTRSTASKNIKLDDFNNEDQRDLESISSNETFRGDNNSGKDAMFANDSIDDFPEGGLKAYLAVLGCCFGLVPCFGILNSLGAIETYISENQLANVESSTVSWIFSIFLFVNFTSCIFSGTFFDRNGAKIPLIVGATLLCGGLFATANCSKVWQYVLAFGVLCGLGNGLTLSPLVSVVPHYFNRKRGFFSSIASTGGSIGGIVFPIMLRKLFDQVGYAWTIRIFSFVVMACHIVAIVFARERLPHVKTDRTTTQKLMSYTKAFDISSFKEWKFVFVVLGCTFAELSITTTSTFYTSYTRAQGASMSTAYLLTTVVNIAGIPGRWLTGYLADRVGRFNVIITILLFAGIITLIILIPFGQHEGALYAFSTVWGFSTGSVFSLLPVCCGQISKTEDFGKRYSTMYFVVAFGTLASIPIGGAIIDDRSPVHFNNFMIYSAITAIAAAGFYTVARILCVGSKFTKKF